MTIHSYKKIPVLYIPGALRMFVSAATSLYKPILQHRDVEDCHTELLFLYWFFFSGAPGIIRAPHNGQQLSERPQTGDVP